MRPFGRPRAAGPLRLRRLNHDRHRIEQRPPRPTPRRRRQKKGGKLKKLILLLLVADLIGGAGRRLLCDVRPARQPWRHAAEEHAGPAAAASSRRASASGCGGPRPRPPRAPAGPIRASSRSTYIPLEGNFTSNLRGGDAFVQIGLGVSTFYDDHVKENVERNMMAIRSAIILTLSEADPVEITTLSGQGSA